MRLVSIQPQTEVKQGDAGSAETAMTFLQQLKKQESLQLDTRVESGEPKELISPGSKPF